MAIPVSRLFSDMGKHGVKTIVTIAVASALAIGHDAAAQPANHCALRLTLVACGMLITCLTAKLVVLTCGSAGISTITPAAVTPRRVTQQQLERLHLGVWLIVGAFLVLVVDWVTLVRTNWRLHNTILLDELVILIPFTVPWLISWAMFFDLQNDQQRAAATSDRWNFVSHNARLVFGVGLLPVLLTCTVADVAQRFDPQLVHGSLAPVIFTVPLFVMLLAYPYILRLLWTTSTLPDGALRARLEGIGAHHGVPVNNILIWHTDQQVCNAVVTGLLPGLRYVFLTDGLLARLSDDEIAAVFAHELGHVKHHHLQKRLLALLLPVTFCVLLSTCCRWPLAASPHLERSGHDILLTYGLLAATIAYLVFVMGWYSRRLEHEADLWACHHLHDASHGQSSYRDYFAALNRISSGQSTRRRDWLHPSYHQRKRFLLQTAKFPQLHSAFRSTMRCIGWGLYAVTAVGLTGLLLRLL